MNPRVFREYDIRGVAERDFDGEFPVLLGRAYADLIRQRATKERPQVAIGCDCRVTSPRLHAGLIEGICRGGVDVIDVGIVPTPMLYFTTHAWEIDGAIVVTGSHNPPEDNGFKVLCGRRALHGEEIQELRRAMEQQHFGTGDSPGEVIARDISELYLEHACSALALGPRRFRVVVDAGNGAGGPTAVALYRRLGFDVDALFCDMDGRFPNHHPDPTQEENIQALRDRVAEGGAELGIALDGDADRVGVIDAKGRILWGDQLMVLFGRHILRTHPGARFIGEVKCSAALFDELEKAGGDPLMWKVGHSLIKAKMKEIGALLGGEMSGHIFFADRYPGFDDGIYAGARLLEILSHADDPLTTYYDSLPIKVNTPELRVECPDEIKFAVVAEVVRRMKDRPDVVGVNDVDGVRASFAHGWGLVRASNTQPALVVRCEADDVEALAQIRALVEDTIAAARQFVAS